MVEYLDYLDGNNTAYLEYHEWRNIEISNLDERINSNKDSQMSCDLCKEIKKRKESNWAKKTIKSVASWWWLDVHDNQCTSGYKVPDWITQFPVVRMNETYDEMRDQLVQL